MKQLVTRLTPSIGDVADAIKDHVRHAGFARCDSIAFTFGGESAHEAGKTRVTTSASPRVQVALDALRDQHERVTRARRAVIEVLDGTEEHLAADEIVARAEASAPGVHRATVYRALATLGELGLIIHTHVGGSATVHHLALPAAATQTSYRHAHLQCTSCQAVIDFPIDVLDSLISRVDHEVGFLVEPHHAALLGLCAECRVSSLPETGHQRQAQVD
jgi:Fur family ferric uptake transcriptional regulator